MITMRESMQVRGLHLVCVALVLFPNAKRRVPIYSGGLATGVCSLAFPAMFAPGL